MKTSIDKINYKKNLHTKNLNKKNSHTFYRTYYGFILAMFDMPTL
jgi:hypothetical protein